MRATLRGIRRTLDTAPEQKAPIVTAELLSLLAATPTDTLAGRRDRALLVLGFAGGLRRSELVSLDAEDITETEDGLRITLRRSKTDQEGEGRELGLPRGQHAPTCPVRVLRAWRSAAGIDSGPPLPTRLPPRPGPGRTAHPPVGRIGGQARLPTLWPRPERAIMRQGGWRSEAMVRRYIRAGTLFEENAASFVGL